MSIPTYKLLRRACKHMSISPSRRFATTLADTHSQEFTLPDGRILGFAEYGDPRGQPLLYFHGFPSSRLEASVMGDMARQRKIRLLAPDRPGFGRSSPQRGHRILDWPADVAAFVTGQNIERFAVMGASGGGPYALACARALPREMLTGVGLFASGPPWWAGRQHMSLTRRVTSRMANQWPWGLTILLQGLVDTARWLLGTAVIRKRLDAWLQGERNKTKPEPTSETSELQRPISEARDNLLRMLIDEPFRQGCEATVHEAKLLSANSWGFDFEDVEYEGVHVWHGAKDKNAPIALIRHMVDRLPRCRFTELSDDTHYTMFQHMAGALDDLIPKEATRSTSKT
ncbi:hypothetical protein HYQ45_001660 [Verticillium longisporum]|uniref:AB hydrolase-1 domain-containing protein n=1 Tax=Verticillium longisporum TaxID=100787 RepID=A0A8I3AWY6_VERLO|nr:hypothetical protein HYQ45_001660 [Verticillium longisporum]RBQ82577.1 hypothetical protein VDGD_05459 [Verticillium dahliae]